MSMLLQKAGYIRDGSGGAYVKYIATREGVERIHGQGPVTKKQKELIQKLLRDYPDSKDLFEYADYTAHPTVSSASDFITMALDVHAHEMKASDVYMKYIATRPRVEKRGDHGLFGPEKTISLDEKINALNAHQGNVWTFIYSLRREDAARLGYDSAEQWRYLLLRHERNIAEAMKISPDHLHWNAAFHDEGHHPHVHVMVWSDDPSEGYLKKDKLLNIRSKLTNDIFQDELHTLYEKKDVSYKELTGAARRAMAELMRQMESSICASPVIEQKLTALAESLKTVTGKKVYGYLKKPVKEQVNAIVDELAKLPEVSEFYEEWNRLRDELESYYKAKGMKTICLPIMADSQEFPVKQKRFDKWRFIIPANGKMKDALADMLGAFSELECDELGKLELHLCGVKEEAVRDILGKEQFEKLKSSMIIHKWMKYEQLIDLYQEMHFLVLAREISQMTLANFPSKVPETMCFGIVPIVSEVGDYTKFYLQDGVNSFFIHGSEIEECKAAIRRALQLTQGEFLAVSKEALYCAKNRFDYRKWTNTVREMLENV